jgi:hypothetical protein
LAIAMAEDIMDCGAGPTLSAVRFHVSAIFVVVLGCLTACALTAEQPGPQEQKLTPECAKEALLQMMSSKSGQELGWFKGNIPEEMAKMKIKGEKDGWYAWTGAIHINPPRPPTHSSFDPVRACEPVFFQHDGSFVNKDGVWSATPPKLVGTALMKGE